MKDDYFKEALGIVDDPYVLVSMIAKRVQMLRRGDRPLVDTGGRLSFEDVALREIIDGRITYILGDLVVLEDIAGLRGTGAASHTGNPWSHASAAPFVNAPCSAGVSA